MSDSDDEKVIEIINDDDIHDNLWNILYNIKSYCNACGYPFFNYKDNKYQFDILYDYIVLTNAILMKNMNNKFYISFNVFTNHYIVELVDIYNKYINEIKRLNICDSSCFRDLNDSNFNIFCEKIYHLARPFKLS